MGIVTQSEEVFLATTALEEFWDSTKPLVFLGEWCLLYERRSYWGALDARVLTGTHDNIDAIERDYSYTSHIYERLLPLLGAALNAIHGTSHGDRYWRILIGPWLRSYISVVHDRYTHIRDAADQYPNLTTIVLSKDSFSTPIDTSDYLCSLYEDAYNLQIVTKILDFLGKDFPQRSHKLLRSPLYDKFVGNRGWRSALRSVANVFANSCAKNSSSILLKNSYFPKKTELQLAARNPGHIQICWSQAEATSQCQYDDVKRMAMRTIHVGDSEFERCLSALLSSEIPRCFVEGFAAMESTSREVYPRTVKAIFSANGWYIDEPFKHWAAVSAENGTMLLGTQHGGNYGALAMVLAEEHETSIVDRYYSWGWTKETCSAGIEILPMPASKLMGKRQVGGDNNKKGILWVGTSAPRYADAFQSFFPFLYKEYLTWQTRFVGALPEDIREEISFRPHYQDYSWGAVDRLRACAPDIQIEQWDIPFRKRLEDCRLYICDHLSTTFAEALAANKPTLLFVDLQANKLRPDAQGYFDLLKKGGILFESPEAAAAAAAAAYRDIEAWWNEPGRQEIVRVFCERFARTSSDDVALWSREFKRLSGLPSRGSLE